MRPFAVHYYYWGHSARQRPSAKGFCQDLVEAYGNASRHMGRGSVYFKAIIIDRQQGTIIAVLTRSRGQISIREF